MLTRKAPLRRSGKPIARSPLRRVSKKRRGENAYYSKKRVAFLQRFKLCAVSQSLFGVEALATEVHHKAGRTGTNFLDEATWLPVCRRGHVWIHEHPGKARERGWLA